MTLNDRFSGLLAAHPELPPEQCLWRAVNAHKAAQAVLATTQRHADAFDLIDAYLANRERPAEPQPQLPLKVAQEINVR